MDAYDPLAAHRPGSAPAPWPFWSALGVFCAAYGVLLAAYLEIGMGPLRPLLIDTLTVKPAAWLIALLAPEHGVAASAHRLVWPGGALSVLNGCDGVDTMILLAAAMAIAPVPLRARAAGVVLGCAMIYALNQARLAGLYFAFRARSEWFDLLHAGIGPLAVIAATAAFYLWWLRRND